MTKGETRKNLPWVEKYRPSTLDDLVSHEDIIRTISKFIRDDQVPHLLFYGPPGTGKTSTILACARQLYSPAQFSSMVLELNASDDRGIGIVRGQILTFASTRTIFKSGFKLIILDEADAMTLDAQNALRRSDLEHQRSVSLSKVRRTVKDLNVLGFVMSAKTGELVTASVVDVVARYLGIPLTKSEKERQHSIVRAELIPSAPEIIRRHSHVQTRTILGDVCAGFLYFESEHEFLYVIEKYTENIRFCIICNYLSKIIPALQSRCTRFRFGPLTPEQILPRLNYVVDEEKVKVSEDGKKALLTLANGDMRKVLNVLQSTWLAFKDVTENNVYTCVGHPLKTDIENIVKWLLNDDFKTTYYNIRELQTVKGLALNDILTEVHNYVHRIEFPYDILIELLDKMAEIQHRLASGTNENIQLTAFIAAFQHVKGLTPVDD